MFGLTRREQRWKAEQKAAETLVGLVTAVVRAKTEIVKEELKVNADSELDRLRAENASLRESVSAKDLQIAELNEELAANEEESCSTETELNNQYRIVDDLTQQLAAAKDEANTARVEAECLAASCKSATEQLAAANGRFLKRMPRWRRRMLLRKTKLRLTSD